MIRVSGFIGIFVQFLGDHLSVFVQRNQLGQQVLLVYAGLFRRLFILL